ncbi:MAG: HAMP domain-containing histidine kinase [Sphingomonadales bacterium]|nr:HAMP domain-containing histidine kinase [Sphingomonadales bacterium]
MAVVVNFPSTVSMTRHSNLARDAFVGWTTKTKEDEGHLAHRLALRSVAAYVAHEINHPLGTIANLAALLSRRIGDSVIRPSELVSQIDAIKLETKRAADTIKNLRVLAGGLHGHSETVNLCALLREAISRFRRRYERETVATRIECRDHALCVQAVPDLLHIALYNLLINGMEALQLASVEKPRLTLRARQADADQVLIDVIDNGPGVSEAINGQIFEPFVSNKPGGSGLGLAICRDIVEWHRGTLTCEEKGARHGACFRIALPKE